MQGNVRSKLYNKLFKYYVASSQNILLHNKTSTPPIDLIYSESKWGVAPNTKGRIRKILWSLQSQF